MKTGLSFFVLLALAFYVASASAGGTCSTTGDPHITTFDGAYYDNYGVGDYFMVKSDDFNVQTRLEKRACSGRNCRDDVGYPSYNRAHALQRKGGALVEVDGGKHTVGRTPDVYLNKQLQSNFPANDHQWHERQGVLFKRGGNYLIIDMKDGFKLRIYHTTDGFRQFYIQVPSSMRGKMLGMCGNFDGSSAPGRELIGRSGKTYPMDTHLHYGNKNHVRPYSPKFTRSWIVPSSEDLLHPPTGATFASFRKQLDVYHNLQSEDIVGDLKFENSHIEALANRICEKLNNKVLTANCLVDSAAGAHTLSDIKGIAKDEHHLLLAMISAAKSKKETKCGIPIAKVQELATLKQKKAQAAKSLGTQIETASDDIVGKCDSATKYQTAYDQQANRINKELRLIEKIKGMATQFGDHHDEKQPLIQMLSALEAKLRKQLEGHLAAKNTAANLCAAARAAKKDLQGKLTFEQGELDKVNDLKGAFDKAMADCTRKEKEYKQCVADRDEIALLIQKQTAKIQESKESLEGLIEQVNSQKSVLAQTTNTFELAKEKVAEQKGTCTRLGNADNKKRATLKKDLALLAQIRESAKGFSNKDHVASVHATLDKIAAELSTALGNVGGEYTACQQTLQTKITSASQKKQAVATQTAKLNTYVEEQKEEQTVMNVAQSSKNTAALAHKNKKAACEKMPKGV